MGLRQCKFRTFSKISKSATSAFAQIAILLLAVGCGDDQPAIDPPATTGSRPNIIFILADDLSYSDLSVYGQQLYTTPHLDRLAETGIRFTQAYSAAPACAPSRACLLTGLHTGHSSIRDNRSARGQDHLRAEDITVAEVLQEAGYKTGFMGKWGVGLPNTEGVPYKQGFDYSFGFYDQRRAHTYFPLYLWENDRQIRYPANQGFDMARRYKIGAPGLPEEFWNVYDDNGDLQLPEVADPANAVYSEEEIEQAALKFIKDNHREPFFVYFGTQLPHGPVIIDNIADMSQPDRIPQPHREWAAMVKRIDTFTGQLVGLLKELGVYENTIIFFASDNGYSMSGNMGRGDNSNWPDDPYLRNKGPFTGGKYSPREGGIRVPFLVSWPARLEPRKVDTPVWLADFFPTAAALAGTTRQLELDGRSLLPLLEGNLEAIPFDRPLYFYRRNEEAVRMGPWKAYRSHPDQPMGLYLVEKDTFEKHDVSGTHPEIVKKIEMIMTSQQTPHEWYWTPGMTWNQFRDKQELANATGQSMTSTYPNELKRIPGY